MEKEMMEKIKKEYELGLNYIENSENARDLAPIYVARLKEIKEELEQINASKEEKTTSIPSIKR